MVQHVVGLGLGRGVDGLVANVNLLDALDLKHDSSFSFTSSLLTFSYIHITEFLDLFLMYVYIIINNLLPESCFLCPPGQRAALHVILSYLVSFTPFIGGSEGATLCLSCSCSRTHNKVDFYFLYFSCINKL